MVIIGDDKVSMLFKKISEQGNNAERDYKDELYAVKQTGEIISIEDC